MYFSCFVQFTAKLESLAETHTILGATADEADWVNTATTLVSAARQGDVDAVIRMLVCRKYLKIYIHAFFGNMFVLVSQCNARIFEYQMLYSRMEKVQRVLLAKCRSNLGARLVLTFCGMYIHVPTIMKIVFF